MQFELALNAGPSHPVKLDVPAHPKEKRVRVRITSAINTFSRLHIALTPPLIYKKHTRRSYILLL